MAIQVTAHELERMQPGMTLDYYGRAARVIKVGPVNFLLSRDDYGRRFRWIEIGSRDEVGTIGFCIEEPPVPEGGRDYRAFLMGCDAYRRGEPRTPPANMALIDPDLPESWLLGYDAERAEQKLLAKYAQ